MCFVIGNREDLFPRIDTFLVNIGVNMQRKTTLDLSKRIMYSFYSFCLTYSLCAVSPFHGNTQNKKRSRMVGPDNLGIELIPKEYAELSSINL